MKILFICKNNQFRSQMAAALYNHLTNTTDADSAGTHVGNTREPVGIAIERCFRTHDFFELMEENGMYIRQNRTKKLSQKLMKQAGIIVSMAEEPFIPDFLRHHETVLWWEVANPTLATRDVSEKTYTTIRALVENLILDIATAPHTIQPHRS